MVHGWSLYVLIASLWLWHLCPCKSITIHAIATASHDHCQSPRIHHGVAAQLVCKSVGCHGCVLVNSILIMNVYECKGVNMFMSWKMEFSIQQGGAKLNGIGTFHLSTNEHICTIARMKNIHYLLYRKSFRTAPPLFHSIWNNIVSNLPHWNIPF